MFTVAIIGRPNVGKSTLFNRLTGSKHALVDDLPGVTRDRREGVGRIGDLTFKLVDTAGLEEAEKDALETRMFKQTEHAVDEADLCLMLIDGRTGLVPDDRFFASWLRKKGKPVAVVANKCEGNRGDLGYNEALGLGFDATLAISAEHGEGIGGLYDVISEYKEKCAKETEDLEVRDEKTDDEKHIQIAILGRPNTGKSTLLNRLYGEDRVLTGPEAGITRDSIAVDWEFEGKTIRLIDTAGIRRKANVTQRLEKMSVGDSLRALRFAHVAVLMIDAMAPLEKQDLAIAELIIREGRAIVLAVNKWDLVENTKAWKEELDHQVEQLLPQIKGVPVVTLSALKGKNVDQVIKACMKAYDIWNKRITTSRLNEWIKIAESRHLPPIGKQSRRIRLKYMTQGNKRPPTFTLFLNRPQDLPESYSRYLVNAMRDAFGLQGVPIRLMLRKSENPFRKEGKKK